MYIASLEICTLQIVYDEQSASTYIASLLQYLLSSNTVVLDLDSFPFAPKIVAENDCNYDLLNRSLVRRIMTLATINEI